MNGANVAVVTGGAQGIGLAIVRRLAAGGMQVASLDANGNEAKKSAAATTEGSVTAYECDVTDLSMIQDVATRIGEDLGKVRVVVGNVGWSPLKPFMENTLEEQGRIIDVNYVSALYTTRVFLPSLAATGTGRLVFISSDAARAGVRGEAIYAGAKAALIGFAKSLALEIARDGVTVNVVCPGTTDTPLLRATFNQEQIDKRARNHPMKRFADPDDIARAVEYFTGVGAAFVNGQVLSVNGGMFRAG